MRNPFHNAGLFRQLIYLIGLTFIIVLVSFAVSNKIAERTVEKKVADSADKIVLQVEETLANFFKDMDGISYSLLYSTILQNYLSSNDPLTKILMNPEIVAEFSSTLALKEEVMGIQLYNREGELATSVGKPFAPVQLRSVDEIKYELGASDQAGMTFYTISVPVYNLQNNRVLKDYRGMCVFFMDVKNFTSVLSKSKLTEHSRLFLTDDRDRIITGSDGPDAHVLADVDQHTSGKSYIVLNKTLANGWRIVSDIPRAELLSELDLVKRLNVVAYAVISLVFLLFLLLFYFQLLRPIRALLDFVNTYTRSGGQARFSNSYHNEIGVLGTSINHMLDSIVQLGNDVQSVQRKMYESELDRKQMEITAYRNQINPHFLYNTLESIRALSLYHKAGDIAEITASLSRLFRYSVKGDNFVTIREEVAHLHEYARIIDFRFRGKIRIAFEVEEALYEVRTLKLLLQPLVENAVFHGLERKIEPGTVTVTLSLIHPDAIRAVVADDGAGFPEDKLEQLQSFLRQAELTGDYRTGPQDSGIGLANSFRRLKLFYGEQAALRIEAGPVQGTVVTLDFPVHISLNETKGALR
ncbi:MULTISPECIES: sensor histidine kinase [unclassified Paenibacillus]|uniref:sensor histidine kinase n=1 Tax=unclassified Paenibacillus TaxID=185978 RepID=UPI0024068224|nr:MULTISPECIES: sensor histidine kinase [unclassified Paenibacillus]MDF9841687.1 two-component system sensor histidine kinase YesM [Paenibacillus sp. PastF-2]MDF9848201.1 two-component system sensor histidine kinase YesM [Paenibacillus sp. PastM-2]MDF9854846.1 two-component system sensor histidine kinase YesM [Paenibacillus sp. PastF-1]MDH6480116.1 two-component system sensor histidine kinase YesM [Paenibacillus sp. PastH-2]MDH6507547.1 two-component system sensor histidine kinase YesM [Paeni